MSKSILGKSLIEAVNFNIDEEVIPSLNENTDYARFEIKIWDIFDELDFVRHVPRETLNEMFGYIEL